MSAERTGGMAWGELVAAALVGTARSGGDPGALLDRVAAMALRRRAGVALVEGAVAPPAAPVDEVPTVGPAAAARADALLAWDSATRDALPVRDLASRLELLVEWLDAAAAAGRRLPAELVPALLDVGRRHTMLRPWIAPVAGPLAGWLAGQRAEWSYAAATPTEESTVDDENVWELGTTGARAGYLTRQREQDPAAGRWLLEDAWATEAPDDRAVLLAALGTGLSTEDEPLLERALDDRRAGVRGVAVDLLARLPASGYRQRMVERAGACVDPETAEIRPPVACDRGMRRDGIVARPPAGHGERAWWLEEILARTPLSVWPEPAEFLAREVSEEWRGAVRRGLVRAAAAQQDPVWAGALVDQVTAVVASHGRPEDRQLLEALYDALPPEDLAARAVGALRGGLDEALAVGVEHLLALCPRPWPAAVADAVFAAIEGQLGRWGAGWRVVGLCELAALRLPAEMATRAPELIEKLPSSGPGVALVERFAVTLRFRHDMLKELG